MNRGLTHYFLLFFKIKNHLTSPVLETLYKCIYKYIITYRKRVLSFRQRVMFYIYFHRPHCMADTRALSFSLFLGLSLSLFNDGVVQQVERSVNSIPISPFWRCQNCHALSDREKARERE